MVDPGQTMAGSGSILWMVALLVVLGSVFLTKSLVTARRYHRYRAVRADDVVATLAAAWMTRSFSVSQVYVNSRLPQDAEYAATVAAEGPSAGEGVLQATPEQFTTNELTEMGLAAALWGDRQIAHRRFLDALEVDPKNEEAWLWSAWTAESRQESIRCLKTVLSINPRHRLALRGLHQLQMA